MSSRSFVAIGDSFTSGVEPDGPPFADLVAARLPGWRYANLAVAGARAADVRDGQLDLALALRPALVSVICGANDVVRTTRPDVDRFATSYNAILLRLRTALPEVVIVTATYPVADFLRLRARTRERVTRGLGEVNAIVRRTAARHAAVCLEFAAHPARAERGNYAADGFHPSAAGHRRAAHSFAACLRDQLGIDVAIEPEGAAA